MKNVNELKVIFIGGLTNGRIALEYLNQNKFIDIPLVITHSDTSLPRYVDLRKEFKELSFILSDDANNHSSEITELSPDLILVAGWPGLLSEEILNIPKLGVIGFHPSRLPYDRGRSVLAWQIEEGYSETALTMFFYNDLPDSGDILGQEKIVIEDNDYINDILNKVDKATYSLVRAYLPLIRKGVEIRKKQEISEGSFRRLRTDYDSLIDWDQNVQVIFNKIRACSDPYPGAIGIIEEKKYRIWKAEKTLDNISDNPEKTPIGALKSKSNKKLIRCRDGFIKLLNFEEIK
tara:strand:+ start:3586 stop:4458 length:873 start_codon:yes stop_codon:yes gene_type:complete